MAHDESHVTVNDVLLAKREVDTYARRSLRVKVLLSLVSGLLSALVFAGAGWLFIRSNIVDLVLPIALVGVFFGALPLVDHVRRVRDLRQRLSSLEARVLAGESVPWPRLEHVIFALDRKSVV